jgi:hypothetical protein
VQQTQGKNNYAALAVIVVVIGVALAGAFAVSAGESDDDGGGGDASGPPPAPGMPGAGEGSAGEGDGDLKVVEQGFSNYTLDTGEDTSAYGFVVENAGDDIYNDAFIEVAAYSPSEKVIWEEEFRTGLLRPGERIGFGDELWTSDVTQPIAKLGVRFPDDGDYKIDDPPDGAYATGDPTTEIGVLGHVTTFAISRTYEGAVGELAVAGAVYRDSAGKIIGGAAAQVTFSGDEAAGELQTYTAIPGVAATEVFAAPTGLLW